MPRSAIPDWGTEYPDYEYKAWPKYVGMTADGEVLTAKDQVQFDEMKEIAAYPKVLGKDKHGNELVAQNPRDEDWLKAKVHVEKAVENALNGEVRRGPGRPRHEAA